MAEERIETLTLVHIRIDQFQDLVPEVLQILLRVDLLQQEVVNEVVECDRDRGQGLDLDRDRDQGRCRDRAQELAHNHDHLVPGRQVLTRGKGMQGINGEIGMF